jgi:glucose-6-phosphate 1-dehydrogenase
MSTEIQLNPFRVGLPEERPPEPCVLVIFGAGGDLAQRKLFPALMNLARDGSLPEQCVMLGVFRSPRDDEHFRQTVFESAAKYAPDAPQDADFKAKFGQRIFAVPENPAEGEAYQLMPGVIERLSRDFKIPGNVLFYLSVPPSQYGHIVKSLGASRLTRPKNNSWTRIIVEKPFGHDLTSARELNRALGDVFDERQIYRIDHYMGKETVQNILVLRLANAFFEPLWNNHFIDHVQITAAESLGVEDRAAYYEEAGALLDMIQNHLLQILSMVALEPSATLAPEAIRNEKAKVLEAIRPFSSQDLASSVVRAQYGNGAVSGRQVPAYLSEKGVNPQSRTETYCALRLWVDNWRWQGVPFYLRTGKRLPKRITEVAIQFKPVPHNVFQVSPTDLVDPNILAIRIQPNEGITLKFVAKLPGHAVRLRSVDMEFRYGTSFGGRISDAYERLLLDAMLGDPTLFARRDAVEEGWRFADPILQAWASDPAPPVPQYAAGSWGPPEADALIEGDGREWRIL